MPAYTFRQLVNLASRQGLGDDERPRTVEFLAESCRISRAHFYNLLTGGKGASVEAVVGVAKGLKIYLPWVTKEIVYKAINRTKATAELCT